MKCLFILYSLVLCHANISRFSGLDRFLTVYRTIRAGSVRLIGTNSDDPVKINAARQLGVRIYVSRLHPNVTQSSLIDQKLQEPVETSRPFPCDTRAARSTERPSSVRHVRPGDIDVIGSLGDSLTAGNGAVASELLHVLIENRGVSWSGGGQGTWRDYFTLPNIVKEFNPKLIGFSLGDSLSIDRKSQFNVAEAGAVSSDLPYMSRVLIRRMSLDERVNVQRDWKLITLMIGANDMCSMICNYKNATDVLRYHRMFVTMALRTLRDNLPRTIVNLVSGPNVGVLLGWKNRPSECVFVDQFECSCMYFTMYANQRKYFLQIAEELQKLDEEIASLSELQTDDFAVVYQPFMMDYYSVPLNFSYYSSDCFHWSQRLQAEIANALWNNMLEPKARKSRRISRLFERVLCPTQEHPYIFT